MTIKDLKKGDFFTLRPIEKPKAAQIYIRGDYDRGLQAYWCPCFNNMSDIRFIESSREVFTDFKAFPVLRSKEVQVGQHGRR